MTSLRNRISLFSIFAFGILIGLVSTVFFVKAHKKQEIPAAFYVATEKIKVVTNISDEFSRRSILGHRDEQLAYTNIPRPLFDSCNKQSVETYRFSYRDAWLRSSFTLSLSARGESANAVWQKFSENREDKRFEYSPPENLSVTEPDWNTLKQTIRRSHILQMPPVALDENGFPIGGADGDSWIIESCVDGQYHFASRWTPYGHEYDSFRSVGKAMIKSGRSRHQTVAIQVID